MPVVKVDRTHTYPVATFKKLLADITTEEVVNDIKIGDGEIIVKTSEGATSDKAGAKIQFGYAPK